MAIKWTLKLGTSFDLESGGNKVANFTKDSASLPGTLNTGNTITVKNGGTDKITLKNDGTITSSGTVSCGSLSSSGSASASGFYVN